MKPFSLQVVLDLMRNRADEASLRLARLITAEHDTRAKLKMLQEYRDEYASRFQQAAANGLSPLQWQNYQEFISRLDEAIGQQQKNVGAQERHTAAGRTHWQQQRVKLHAFDSLSQKHHADEVVREIKLEQKLQDEASSRREQKKVG